MTEADGETGSFLRDLAPCGVYLRLVRLTFHFGVIFRWLRDQRHVQEPAMAAEKLVNTTFKLCLFWFPPLRRPG